MNKNNVLVGIAVIAIVVTGVLIFANSNHGFSLSLPTIFGKSDSQIGKDTVDYINNNKLSQSPASLVSASEVSGMVKIKIKIGTNEFDSYVTKDGKLLFPAGNGVPFDMSAKKVSASADTNTAAQTAEQIIAAIKKSDKPVLEAFVASDCPFGLQMQRMIADAVKSVPSMASNIVVRYLGSISGGQISSMHDANPNGLEGQENLRQICIREEQPAKYWNYVSCYMKKASGSLPNGMPIGDSAGCLTSTGIDTAKLNSCISNPSKGLAYAKKDFDLSDTYGASSLGSPTLVVNGAVTSEFTSDNKPVFGSSRSSDEIKTIVCDASQTKPSFCSKTLNTTEAATSFSATYASASGSAGGNTNCAPAQ